MTQTTTTQSLKPLQLLHQWLTEKEDYLLLLTERMLVQKKWVYGDDQARAEYYKPKYLLTKDQVETLQFEIQEVREALKVFDREQRLKEALDKIEEETRDEWIGVMIRGLLSTLYPDTPAEPADRVTEKWDTARPIDEWHEDIGPVLWWTFPIEELPYVGTPLDGDWPGYHTHWAPFIIPFAPAPKEGTRERKPGSCPNCGLPLSDTCDCDDY